MRSLAPKEPNRSAHVVTVLCYERLDKNAPLAIPRSLIPSKYSDPATTPLRFEVIRGENSLVVELK